MVRWKKSKKDVADQMTLLCLLDILVYNLWTETNSAFYDNIEALKKQHYMRLEKGYD